MNHMHRVRKIERPVGVFRPAAFSAKEFSGAAVPQ
jgi:hypothetical protein